MSKFSVKKSLTVFMAVIAAIVIGIVSYTRMTPDLLPSMDLPYVIVITTYPGATPEKVETVVTRPMEQTMATLDGIVNVGSTSAENMSMLMLEFNEDINMDSVTVDILQKVELIEGSWDDMVGTPILMKLNPNMLPVAVAAVQVEGMDRTQLSDFLEETLLNKLEGTDGVASITPSGILETEITVMLSQSRIDSLYEKIYEVVDKNFEKPQAEIDAGRTQLKEAQKAFDEALKAIDDNPAYPDEMKEMAKEQILNSEEYLQVVAGLEELEKGQEELDKAKKAAHGAIDLTQLLSMDTLSGILTAQDFAMPAGYVKSGDESWMINVGDEIASIEEIQNLVLLDMKMEGLEPIRIKDVADVVVTDNAENIYATVNGGDGIVLSFSKQSSYATATVAENITKKFDELSKEYDGLKFTSLMDQGEYIELVVDSIMSSLLWGALFSVIVLFIFLKDIRPTFITLCSIPVSLLVAIVLMYFTGVSLNMMSLSGLAIAVGMLVDNSIVVIENIYRLRAKGVSRAKAAISGASQVAGAILSSTLTTICVFLPIVFIDGITRTLFVDMALTLAYSLMASVFIALTFVPAMASKILKDEDKTKEKKESKFIKGYKKFIGWSISHKIVVFIVVIVLLVGSFALELTKGFVFMPDMDMPQLSATLTTELGTTQEETIKIAEEAIKRMLTVKEVETVGSMMGSGSMMGLGGGGDTTSNSIQMYIMLDENKDRKAIDIAKELNEMCADLEGEFEVASAMDMGALMGGSGVTINLYGEDLENLQLGAKEIGQILEKVEGTANVLDGLEENDPALKITVDKEKAMKNGLTVAQVYMEISKVLTLEKKAIDVIFEDASYAVYVSTENTEALTTDDIRAYEFEVTNMDQSVSNIKLTDIATIEDTETLTSINRTNQRRYLTVSAEIADGHNVTLVSNKLEEALKDYKAPAGVTYELSGETETIAEAMKDLLLMMLLAVMLIYMIMVAQFQSLKSPFIIMFTIPLAFTGGMLGLLVTGMEVSIIALVGFVMLCGIIVNNGIVLVDYINQLRQEGMERREAIIEAGAVRLRPVIMTSLTTILGQIVMAFGSGSGAAIMQPIAVVCIGGLLYATLLTLVVVPCLYDLMNKKELKVISKEDLEISTL